MGLLPILYIVYILGGILILGYMWARYDLYSNHEIGMIHLLIIWVWPIWFPPYLSYRVFKSFVKPYYE